MQVSMAEGRRFGKRLSHSNTVALNAGWQPRLRRALIIKLRFPKMGDLQFMDKRYLFVRFRKYR